ncbi:MAG: PilN domain-containing protein [Gemmatimonadota bacterium]
MAAGIAALVAISGCAWLYLGVFGAAEELEVRTEVAVRDSIRYEDVIQRSGVLQARRDSIAQRVSIIQEIDGSRYVWPHIMDEVARALPDYTWLTRLIQVTGGSPVLFRLEGRSGTYFGLTTLMENLEASPFITGVELISSEQISISLGGGANQLVYQFILEGSSREPPPEIVERVPLFGPSVVPPGTEGD